MIAARARSVAALALAAGIALFVAAALVAPERPAGVVPLRVTSGNEVATGVAVGGDRVVTVAHAIDGPVTVRISRSGAERRARVVATRAGTDLALLEVPGLERPHADVAEAEAGDRLRLVRIRDGLIGSQPVRVRRTIDAHVSGAGGGAGERPALELAGRARSGDSGAPVVTAHGAIAGIVFATSRTRRNTAYAVDASALHALLDAVAGGR